MWWLIIGLVLGAAALWLASWARSKNVSIKWYTWIPIVLAVLFFALMVMESNTMAKQMEPAAAGFVLGFYGIPGLVLALIAGGLVWWQNKKTAKSAKA